MVVMVGGGFHVAAGSASEPERQRVVLGRMPTSLAPLMASLHMRVPLIEVLSACFPFVARPYSMFTIFLHAILKGSSLTSELSTHHDAAWDC